MRRISVIIITLALATLGSVACAGSGDEGWVTKYAEERLACSKQEITVTTLEVNYFEATGCGKSDRFMKVCISTSCKLNAIADLSTRAGFDLSCDPQQVTIAKLDRDTMGVSGCGQQATYKATLEGWVMNNSATVAPAGDPAPASTEPAVEAPSPTE